MITLYTTEQQTRIKQSYVETLDLIEKAPTFTKMGESEKAEYMAFLQSHKLKLESMINLTKTK